MEIWTWVFIFVYHALLTTKPSPQPTKQIKKFLKNQLEIPEMKKNTYEIKRSIGGLQIETNLKSIDETAENKYSETYHKETEWFCAY